MVYKLIYTGLLLWVMMGNVFHVGVRTWCLHQKGPIFVAMFRPMGVAIAAVMVVFFLGDPLHFGRLDFNFYY